MNLVPSPSLIAKFEAEHVELNRRLDEEESNGVMIAAGVEQLEAEHVAALPMFEKVRAEVDQMQAEIADRWKQIEAGRARVSQARKNVEAMRVDIEVLADMIERGRQGRARAGVAAVVRAGRQATRPNRVIPEECADCETTGRNCLAHGGLPYPTDTAATCARPECGQPIVSDPLSGWYHVRNNSQYCHDSDDSPTATPAPAALVVDDAPAEVA